MTWTRPRPPVTLTPPPGDTTYIDWGPALPERTGETRITALVRDPENFFACWEGGDRIRARDLTDGTVREHAVGFTGSWYFTGTPEHDYEVDLLQAGKVVGVSNRVRLPRRDPAVLVDEDWVPTPGQLELLRALAGRLELVRKGLEEGMHS